MTSRLVYMFIWLILAGVSYRLEGLSVRCNTICTCLKFIMSKVRLSRITLSRLNTRKYYPLRNSVAKSQGFASVIFIAEIQCKY